MGFSGDWLAWLGRWFWLVHSGERERGSWALSWKRKAGQRWVTFVALANLALVHKTKLIHSKSNDNLSHGGWLAIWIRFLFIMQRWNYTKPNSSEASKGTQPRQNVRTWEKLSTIKSKCGIELGLDECVAILNYMHRLKRIAERASCCWESWVYRKWIILKPNSFSQPPLI